jgi:hypothetical protein
MHEYIFGAPFERIAIDVAGPFPLTDQGNRYLLIAIDYFTKLPEAYALPNQEVSSVAKALVTNFFCYFCIPREIYNDQGCNIESRLLQEILQRLEVSNTRTTILPKKPKKQIYPDRYGLFHQVAGSQRSSQPGGFLSS